MKPKRLLKNIQVKFISLVDRPANRKKIILKSEDFDESEATFERVVKIEKMDPEKRVVYGIVYAPNEVDAHGDITTPEEIEKALESFMREGRTRYVDKNHDYQPDEGFVREAWIVKEGDPLFDEVGAWAVGIKVTNNETWQEIKEGKITGLSFAGYAEADYPTVQCLTKLEKAGKTFWHNVLPISEFYDPRYGKVKVTRELVQKLAENFKKGYPFYKLPLNISHDDVQGKFGNIVDVKARDDGLWVKIELTDLGARLLEQKRFEYLSAEYKEDFVDKETGKKVGPVLLGVALTNRPAHPKVKPISFSETVKRVFGKLVELFEEVKPFMKDESMLEDFGNILIELDEELGEGIIELALTKEDKEEFLRRIRREGVPQLLEAHKWLHAYASSGKLPTGTTKQDLVWMHNAIVKELNRRKKAKGEKVEPHPTPLKFADDVIEVDLSEDDEVYQFCLGPTLRKLKARAKKKQHSEEVSGVKFEEKVAELERRVEVIEKKLSEPDGKEEEVKKAAKDDRIEELAKSLKELSEDVKLLKSVVISKAQEPEKKDSESIFKGLI